MRNESSVMILKVFGHKPIQCRKPVGRQESKEDRGHLARDCKTSGKKSSISAPAKKPNCDNLSQDGVRIESCIKDEHLLLADGTS